MDLIFIHSNVIWFVSDDEEQLLKHAIIDFTKTMQSLQLTESELALTSALILISAGLCSSFVDLTLVFARFLI